MKTMIAAPKPWRAEVLPHGKGQGSERFSSQSAARDWCAIRLGKALTWELVHEERTPHDEIVAQTFAGYEFKGAERAVAVVATRNALARDEQEHRVAHGPLAIGQGDPQRPEERL